MQEDCKDAEEAFNMTQGMAPYAAPLLVGVGGAGYISA